MRVTIIKADGFVSVDGLGFSGLNLAFLDDDFHALQWYDTHGEIEWKHLNDNGLRIVENEAITDVAPYQQAISLWQQAKEANDQRIAEQLAIDQNTQP